MHLLNCSFHIPSFIHRSASRHDRHTPNFEYIVQSRWIAYQNPKQTCYWMRCCAAWQTIPISKYPSWCLTANRTVSSLNGTKRNSKSWMPLELTIGIQNSTFICWTCYATTSWRVIILKKNKNYLSTCKLKCFSCARAISLYLVLFFFLASTDTQHCLRLSHQRLNWCKLIYKIHTHTHTHKVWHTLIEAERHSHGKKTKKNVVYTHVPS